VHFHDPARDNKGSECRSSGFFKVKAFRQSNSVCGGLTLAPGEAKGWLPRQKKQKRGIAAGN
jgi:hypothetical protein